jgi:hypothetical protein
MEDLKRIATDIALHTNSVVKVLNDKLRDCYHQGKSRAGSTPYKKKET